MFKVVAKQEAHSLPRRKDSYQCLICNHGYSLQGNFKSLVDDMGEPLDLRPSFYKNKRDPLNYRPSSCFIVHHDIDFIRDIYLKLMVLKKS